MDRAWSLPISGDSFIFGILVRFYTIFHIFEVKAKRLHDGIPLFSGILEDQVPVGPFGYVIAYKSFKHPFIASVDSVSVISR